MLGVSLQQIVERQVEDRFSHDLDTLRCAAREDIAAKAGTNRIEPLGKLAVRPIVEGYPVKKDIPRPSLNIDISVQVTDDKNNVVKTTKRVPVS